MNEDSRSLLTTTINEWLQISHPSPFYSADAYVTIDDETKQILSILLAVENPLPFIRGTEPYMNYGCRYPVEFNTVDVRSTVQSLQRFDLAFTTEFAIAISRLTAPMKHVFDRKSVVDIICEDFAIMSSFSSLNLQYYGNVLSVVKLFQSGLWGFGIGKNHGFDLSDSKLGHLLSVRGRDDELVQKLCSIGKKVSSVLLTPTSAQI